MLQLLPTEERMVPRIESLPPPDLSLDLAHVETIIANTLAPYRQRFGPIIDRLQQYRGKRLRPMLVLLAAKACGGITQAHRTLAAVVELIHTATLVHDDVLDESPLRRHASTVNADWGNKTAILLGDLLFTSAFHLSSTVGDVRACQWIGEATNRVCAGELQQVMERGNLHLRAEDYFAIVDGKTAALTECSCRLGAAFAEADDHVVEAMGRYGLHLGRAFQIADDLLDLLGNESTVGKTLGTDLDQQKLTLPLLDLFATLPEATAERFRELWQHDLSAFRTEVRKTLITSGSSEKTHRRAMQEAATAIRQLDLLAPTPERDQLAQIARWSVRRER